MRMLSLEWELIWTSIQTIKHKTNKKTTNFGESWTLQLTSLALSKLDGVGPVDNRPSNEQLHQFVQKKEQQQLFLPFW